MSSGRAEDAQHERGAACRRGARSRRLALAVPRSAAATSSRPTARLPFTSTASPARDASRATRVERGRGVGHLDDARRPRSRARAARAARPRARPRRARRPRRRPTSAPTRACSALAVLAELAHLAEHRDPAAGRVDARERVERGGHRRRVGVVGVVEHDDARRRCARAPCATARARTRGEPGGDVVERHAARQRDRGRERGVHHLVRAAHRERDRARSPRRLEPERGRSSASRRDVDAPARRRRHAPADDQHARGRRCGRRARASSRVAGVEHRQAVGRRAPRAARPSPARSPARPAEGPGVRRGRCW